MKPLGIGIIGCGEIAFTYHLPALLRIKGARIVAVADNTPEKALRAAQEYHVPRHYPQALSLLQDPDVEAVLILTPNLTRLEMVQAAAEAKKPMLVQKPLARSSSDCEQISQIAKDAGVLIVPSFMHRYLPEVLKARELILQGVLGDIRMVRMRNATPGSSWSSWFFRRELVGGGAAIDLGVHGIDLVRWLAGEIRTVNAATRTLVSERIIHGQRIVPDNEDTVVAIYGLENGGTCVHEISWTQYAGYSRFEMEIFGSDGTIFIRSGLGPIAVASKHVSTDGQWFLPDLPRQFLGAVHHQDFVDAVRQGPTPLTAHLQDGVRSIEIVSAIYQSAQADRTITV
jgi:predicted dehydrogenase